MTSNKQLTKIAQLLLPEGFPEAPAVIAMRAIPGSGKSTYAKRMKEYLESLGQTVVIASADEYPGLYSTDDTGKINIDFSKIGLAHKACYKKFFDALKEGVDFIFIDNTSLSQAELSPYAMLADQFGYKFIVHELETVQEEAFQRQTHGVPEKGHKGMQERFEKHDTGWYDVHPMTSESTPGGSVLFHEKKKAPEPEPIKSASEKAQVIRSLIKKFDLDE